MEQKNTDHLTEEKGCEDNLNQVNLSQDDLQDLEDDKMRTREEWKEELRKEIKDEVKEEVEAQVKEEIIEKIASEDDNEYTDWRDKVYKNIKVSVKTMDIIIFCLIAFVALILIVGGIKAYF